MHDKKLDDLFIQSFNEAANSLSQLTNKNVSITSLKVELLSGEDLVNQIEYKLDDLYFGSIIKTKDKLNTNIVFLISGKDGLGLYDTINGNKAGTTKQVSEEVVSAIGEINNILGCTFINNLANLFKKEIHPMTPINNYDFLGAVLQGVILQEELLNKKVLCANTIIKESDKEEFHSRFFIMSDKDELFKLMKKA